MWELELKGDGNHGDVENGPEKNDDHFQSGSTSPWWW